MQGAPHNIDDFVERLQKNKPKLARIDKITRKVITSPVMLETPFEIKASIHSQANTGVMADAATCDACLSDIFSPKNRRYRYPFTNCTHCGPRLSIIRGIPYDREQTSMAKFSMCKLCQQEYDDVFNRRFHAQPNACPECGPQYWLTDHKGKKVEVDDILSTTAAYLQAGKIVAIKGIGSFHLAVLASHSDAVSRLRALKKRPSKPLALMAENISMIKSFCTVSSQEQSLLQSVAAPIVLLNKKTPCTLPENIAPKQKVLGFMLPYSPLHHLLLDLIAEPIVLTSANISQEPPCIRNEEALEKLTQIADYFLLHNRDIENRIDDSIVRIIGGKTQLIRRARGYAPQSIILPEGFETASNILALGGELKNTFCLIKKGQAIISQHMGDLENYATYCDFQHNLFLYEKLFQHSIKHLVADAHPEYISNKVGQEMAEKHQLTLVKVQHHHAHVASCLAENNYGLNKADVLAVVLDGLGFGDDDTLWGGEFLLANYEKYTRLASLKPVALLGASKAMREPWRNLYAHLQACMLRDSVFHQYQSLDIIKKLTQKPLKTMDAMLMKNINTPIASSAGRLFDAVAAALDICFDHIEYEGQAAIALEAEITAEVWDDAAHSAYPFTLESNIIDPCSMWEALFKDLASNTPAAIISTRFHKGLSLAIVQQLCILAKDKKLKTVVLSGGVFQNKTLLEAVKNNLEKQGFCVLTHHNIPANDGGLSLGQAIVAAAKIMRKNTCV